MAQEESIRKLVRSLLSEQEMDDSSMSGFGSQDDWSSPTGRKSNAYIIAEGEALSKPAALLQRLGTTKLDTPKTNTAKDVENFVRQVIMKNSDLSQVYGKVTFKDGNIFVERRTTPNSSTYDDRPDFPTSSASSARYISLLMVAGGALGWVKFKRGFDTVMFGGAEDSMIRIVPNSYSAKSTETKQASKPVQQKAAQAPN